MTAARTVFDRMADAAAVGPHVLVPTMGGLHRGHAELIRAGVRDAADRGLRGGCVVTVFVNPRQFNQPADFDGYPRDLDADCDLAFDAGAAAVLAPGVDEVYPARAEPGPAVPAVGAGPGLEDRWRPGHFEGVCAVLDRFFIALRPDAVVMGEKDWQQLAVVCAMLEGRDGPRVIAAPTVREPDGLAMSTRNERLTPAQRIAARAIPRALHAAGACHEPEAAEAAMARVLAGVALEVEYAVVRDAATLGPPSGGPARALIAAHAGSARLIDNAAWPGGIDTSAGRDA